jgi:hypothetical protein
MYLTLANLIALIHIGSIVYFFWAIIQSLRGRLNSYPVAKVFLWGWIFGKSASYILFTDCVFTMAERYFREAAGDTSYTTGFIQHYTGLLGISISYNLVACLVIAPVVIAILSESYWYHRITKPSH